MYVGYSAVGWSENLDAFSLALKVEGLKPHTISCYVRDVQRLGESVDWIPPAKVTARHVRTHIEALRKLVSAKTVHESQLGIRRFFKYLVSEREIRRDPSRQVRLTKYRVVPQPTYAVDDLKKLLAACDQSAGGARDRAIVTVLFDTGVRVGELVSMGLPDVDRRQVKVDGKTGVRIVPLGDASLLAIQRYLRRWSSSFGPLWHGIRGPLTESGVLQIVRRLCAAAGVNFKRVHAFRRAAAAQMKRLGMNDSDILEVMGWKDVTMLRRYTAAVATELAHRAHSRHSPADLL